MPEFTKSQLPQDSSYWEELERRIRQDASGPLARYAAAQDAWYHLLARRAPWIVTAAAAAMLIMVISLSTSVDPASVRSIEQTLAPFESSGALLVGPEPPSVEALLVSFAPSLDEGERR